jgi:hypothetical protein
MRAAVLPLVVLVWLVLGCSAGGRPADSPPPSRPDPSDRGTGSGVTADEGRTHPPADTARPSPAPARQVLRGTFVEIQEGDYVHIVIRDQAGNIRSFFIAPELPASVWEPFIGSQHQGKAVEVTWEEVRRFLPEAGAEETIQQATNIRLLE